MNIKHAGKCENEKVDKSGYYVFGKLLEEWKECLLRQNLIVNNMTLMHY